MNEKTAIMSRVKKGKGKVIKKSKKSRKLSLYSNLSNSRKAKKDAEARKKAEYLASLPKHPVKRLLYRMHPKRVLSYWFSKKGALMALRIIGIIILVITITIGCLFLYFRKDLDKIRPGEISDRVQTTVTRYLDRNGELLWEDKGDGNYKRVVKSEEINKHMKEATVAIEDADFYKHHGVSFSGIVRAGLNNFTGGSTQGGSTLTQQLIKQIFFADEASERGLKGIPRKIKEMILAVEIERMYSKDEILTLYLNESPYGGRRNGVQSGALAYFGKPAKDLTLAEAALLAGIPNQPSLYNPYNTHGHKALIARQHKTLDAMVKLEYITKKEAEEAKKVPILDTIRAINDEYDSAKAPHFVYEVKKRLEKELGVKTMRSGGFTIKTTLDLGAQQIAEEAVAKGSEMLARTTGADNMALTSVDNETGQVIAQVGSVDYNKPKYGQQNAATSPLEPGSSIKPIVDFAPLFKQREGVNYGPGSIIPDGDINKLYCGNYRGKCSVKNYSGGTYGNISIRKSLGGSLNRPSIVAMHINGIEDSIQTARDLGDISYCADNNQAGLSSAIGGGCTVRQDEHTNAFASLARNGVYKPVSYVLEVKNREGEIVKAWKDQPKQAVDPQVAYMITSILTDADARTFTFGGIGHSYGFIVPGVVTATKTGTTENGQGSAKDNWMMSYSSAISVGVWQGKHDGSGMVRDDSAPVRMAVNEYMRRVHPDVYAKQGKWKPGDQIAQPAGLKRMTINGNNDLWPSWYDASKDNQKEKMVFDKVSKKKATDCTPEEAKIELEVMKINDPITKKPAFIAPDGYDATKEDDTHNCSDAKPTINNISLTKGAGSTSYVVTTTVAQGTHPLTTLLLKVDGKEFNVPINGNGSYAANVTIPASTSDKTIKIEATLKDEVFYSTAGSKEFKIGGSSTP